MGVPVFIIRVQRVHRLADFLQRVITTELIENSQSIRQQPKARTDLGRESLVFFEHDKVDADFLEHVGQRQACDAASHDDYFEWGHRGVD